MPVNNAGNISNADGVNNTPPATPEQNPSSSEFTSHLTHVQQAAYGRRRGHQRNNAVNLRAEKLIDFTSIRNPVSSSDSPSGGRSGLATINE